MSEAYEMFNDIEDQQLRMRNRAVMMANIYQDNCNKAGELFPSGMKELVKYFNNVPAKERNEVRKMFGEQMRERGYLQGGVNG